MGQLDIDSSNLRNIFQMINYYREQAQMYKNAIYWRSSKVKTRFSSTIITKFAEMSDLAGDFMINKLQQWNACLCDWSLRVCLMLLLSLVHIVS